MAEQQSYEHEVGEHRSEFVYGTGCPTCAHTGYLGRTGIFEILMMTERIRTMITDKAERSQIRDQAIKDGMVPLIMDGMNKVKAGITTPAEVLRSAYVSD